MLPSTFARNAFNLFYLAEAVHVPFEEVKAKLETEMREAPANAEEAGLLLQALRNASQREPHFSALRAACRVRTSTA